MRQYGNSDLKERIKDTGNGNHVKNIKNFFFLLLNILKNELMGPLLKMGLVLTSHLKHILKTEQNVGNNGSSDIGHQIMKDSNP